MSLWTLIAALAWGGSDITLDGADPALLTRFEVEVVSLSGWAWRSDGEALPFTVTVPDDAGVDVYVFADGDEVDRWALDPGPQRTSLTLDPAVLDARPPFGFRYQGGDPRGYDGERALMRLIYDLGRSERLAWVAFAPHQAAIDRCTVVVRGKPVRFVIEDGEARLSQEVNAWHHPPADLRRLERCFRPIFRRVRLAGVPDGSGRFVDSPWR